jgi:predicted  nucleic acid-binding Zn-ribbon protein
MTEEEYEDLYDEREKALKYQIRTQEWALRDAQMACAHEAKKLADLQYKLKWLHLELRDERQRIEGGGSDQDHGSTG